MTRIGLLIIIFSMSAVIQSQSFSVAIVKKAQLADEPGSGCHGIDAGPTEVPQGRCRYSTVKLRSLIITAYSIDPQQLIGTVDWMTSDVFTLEGVSRDSETVTQQELIAMLQHEIESTFKLKYHRETKTLPGFVLTVIDEKKLAPSDGRGFSVMMAKEQVSGFHGPLTALPGVLSSYLKAPVKDETRVTTRYTVELDWRGAANNDEARAKLFEQLAEKRLKLTPQELTVDYFVVDSAEKPKG